MKKIYGNSLIGDWYWIDLRGESRSITPKRLKEQENNFDWVASNVNYPNNLYPYKDGVQLEYDEAV